MIAAFESITWVEATGAPGSLPDADLDVLCCLAHGGGVYVGAWVGEGWIDCSGAEMPGEVTHWADMPEGPAP